jgi:hypothetical protein
VIEIDNLDVTDLSTNGLLFEFRRGMPGDLPEYVGANDDIPYASGQDFGAWRRVKKFVQLYGQVIGSGNTFAEQQASFRSRMDALKAVMDVASLVEIETTDEFGVGSATLSDVQPLRMVAEAEFAEIVWIGRLELECIDSPPEWVTGS